MWSSGVGLARTLLALGTTGTLIATDPTALMSYLADGTVPPICQGAGQAGIWCVAPDLDTARWLSAATLLIVASGWRPRTAMFYWTHHPTFGSPGWLRPLTDLITGSPLGVAAMTWGSIALEFALALGIVLNARARRVLLVCGLLFHAGIAAEMGLISFFFAMAGALLLYLLPVGHHIVVPSWNERRRRVHPSRSDQGGKGAFQGGSARLRSLSGDGQHLGASTGLSHLRQGGLL